MEKIAITFRDFTAHLIPGLMYFCAYFYVIPQNLSLISGREVIFSIGGIFAAYAVGFLADTVFYPKFNKVLRKIPLFKDPMRTYFSKELKEEPNTIRSLAYKLLSEHLGQTIVENTKNTVLIYMCIRYVETKNTYAANFLTRINSLGNLSISMAPPLIIIAIIAAVKIHFIVCAVSVFLVYFTLRKNLSYRDWLARSAVRHYVLLRTNELTGK